MNRAKRFCIWIGGLALLAATATDTLAVIGRAIGAPLPGSIELMQAIVLVSGTFGLIIATLDDSHARVRILVDRLSPARRVLADRFSDLLALLFVLALLAGSVWLSVELWGGHEQSEVVGVPWALLRMIANGVLLAVAGILAWRIVRRSPRT
ncbi:TRAP transporter small permease [Altererythrobacter lauratis]|uniref:TRAP transporter small permease protein n=1 Tax=Alteraurantiacibacter lauratis TaxID=2054627 RepID=A0ABV7EHU5_9SPHN